MTNEVTIYEPEKFLIHRVDDPVGLINGAVKEFGLGTTTLPKIAMPTGGGSFFTVPGLIGERAEKELDVTITHIVGNQKAWYRIPMEESEGGSPPDCSSRDGQIGIGFNSLEVHEDGAAPEEHDCATCPWNQFGSKRGGSSKGKDCRDFAWMYFFEQGSALPMVLSVPPTSLKEMRAYLVQLMSGGAQVHHVVTRLSLEHVAGTPDYSRLNMSFAGALDEATRERMDELSEAAKKIPLPSAAR